MSKPLSYPDTYLKSTNQELIQASETLTKLQAKKASCKTCAFARQKNPWLTCSLKSNKIIQHYNICIHHSTAKKES